MLTRDWNVHIQTWEDLVTDDIKDPHVTKEEKNSSGWYLVKYISRALKLHLKVSNL